MNKKHFLRIFVAAFILALVPQIVSAVLSLFQRTMIADTFSIQLATVLGYINVVVRYVVAPLLIFAVFYFMEKETDLKLELRPILLALLIGNIASFFIGSIIYSSTLMGITVDLVLGITLQVLVALLVANLLAALAGLSMGNIRLKKLTPSV